ncbi:DUF3999 family protein [Janthinobacterium fluminis]|uniref:DUF3999 family protein n=1 Tax=Janthinobacterium fluminis TaxID=2987524 RepID=A0ABT5K261_9BURK|nr:DUF3999 family protein [Janthinobacterium fluminis]MDC8759063.1 DUF3999 family protein [Janthinobacterium fluminis]
MRAVLILMATLALAPGAAAAKPDSDTPADYTHSLPLSVSGKAGVVAYRLPQAVYLHASSSELDDVRLFDRQGSKLAFALRRPPAQARTSRRDLPVSIFPVAGGQPDTGAGDEAGGLDIRTGADGRLLSVTRSARGGATASKPGLGSLVLDIGAAGKDPAAAVGALRFRLPAGTGNYNAQVWLEVSDDLKRWDALGAASLNWLVNSDTQTLANDRIEFEPRRFRYARLSWREGAPLLFAGISAESLSQTEVAAPTEQLLLQPAPGQLPQDLVYRGAAAIPVEKVGLQFAEQNIVLPAVLGRYREVPSRQLGQPSTLAFEPLLRTTFYQITQAGQRRGAADLAMAQQHAAQWVLRPDAASGARPALRLVWSPSSLVFLANGMGPYTLAFGRAGAHRAAIALEQVAPGFSEAELLNLEQARAGPLAANPAAAAAPGGEADRAAQLRLAALWGALLLGVAVLGFFAWRLLRQMQAQDRTP